MKFFKKVMSLLLVFAACFMFNGGNQTAYAASKSVNNKIYDSAKSMNRQIYTNLKDKQLMIMNVATNLSLHDMDCNDVVVYSYCGESNLWRLELVDNGWFKIINVRTGLSLSATGGSGKKVVVNNGNDNSHYWNISKSKNGNYIITNVDTNLTLHNTKSNEVVMYNYCERSNEWLFFSPENVIK